MYGHFALSNSRPIDGRLCEVTIKLTSPVTTAPELHRPRDIRQKRRQQWKPFNVSGSPILKHLWALWQCYGRSRPFSSCLLIILHFRGLRVEITHREPLEAYPPSFGPQICELSTDCPLIWHRTELIPWQIQRTVQELVIVESKYKEWWKNQEQLDFLGSRWGFLGWGEETAVEGASAVIGLHWSVHGDASVLGLSSSLWPDPYAWRFKR